MNHESRQPDTDAGGPPDAGPQMADVPVLSVNEAGAVSARKRGKAGPSTTKARTAAKRKPETKPPARKKAAAKKAGARAGKSFRTQDEASGGWRTKAKVAGRKPSASQKKGPVKGAAAKKTAAKRGAAGTRPATKRPAAKSPAAKRGTAKRATRR